MALPCASSSSLFFSTNPATPSHSEWQPYLLLFRSNGGPPLRRQALRPPSSSSRRPPNFPPEPLVVASDPRSWREIRALNEEYGSDEDDEDSEGEDDDRSLDLFVRFLHNLFRRVSRRVRKAVRSVLPVPISTKLVGFSVDGILILAFLWVLKALLEVVCTLGSMVFVCILLVRGVWSGVSYLQAIRYNGNRFDGDDTIWSSVQPAT